MNNKQSIHTTILKETFDFLIETAKKSELYQGEVIDKAISLLKKEGLNRATEVAGDSGTRQRIHTTILKETFNFLIETAKKLKLNQGEVIDIAICLLKSEASNCKSKTPVTVITNSNCSNNKEDFSITSDRDEILFVLFRNIGKEFDFLSLRDQTGLDKKCFQKAVLTCRKRGYVEYSGRGRKTKYQISQEGVAFFRKLECRNDNKESRIKVFLDTLEKYTGEGKNAKKPSRVERIIYALLLEPDYKESEIEIAKETRIDPSNISKTLRKMEKYWTIEDLGKGKRKIATLNIGKLMREGLPPRPGYEWRVLKFLNENQGPFSTREIYSKVWGRSAGSILHEWEKNPFYIERHLYRVLEALRKKGLILGEKTIVLTDKGDIAFDAYRKKNIAER